MANEIPYGYCHCGCGKKTNISKWTDKRLGTLKGEPYHYLNGHSKKAPVEVRFWKYVNKSDGCWEWVGNKHQQGYGLMGDSNRGKTLKSHRISWEIHNGPIPEKMCVLHKCDNTSCVNPNHLFLGTQQDNITDMVSKGRQRTGRMMGSTNPISKLTEAQVLEIRALVGTMTQKAISSLYSVGEMTISRVVNRKLWGHI